VSVCGGEKRPRGRLMGGAGMQILSVVPEAWRRPPAEWHKPAPQAAAPPPRAPRALTSTPSAFSASERSARRRSATTRILNARASLAVACPMSPYPTTWNQQRGEAFGVRVVQPTDGASWVWLNGAAAKLQNPGPSSIPPLSFHPPKPHPKPQPQPPQPPTPSVFPLSSSTSKGSHRPPSFAAISRGKSFANQLQQVRAYSARLWL